MAACDEDGSLFAILTRRVKGGDGGGGGASTLTEEEEEARERDREALALLTAATKAGVEEDNAGRADEALMVTEDMGAEEEVAVEDEVEGRQQQQQQEEEEEDCKGDENAATRTGAEETTEDGATAAAATEADEASAREAAGGPPLEVDCGAKEGEEGEEGEDDARVGRWQGALESSVRRVWLHAPRRPPGPLCVQRGAEPLVSQAATAGVGWAAGEARRWLSQRDGRGAVTARGRARPPPRRQGVVARRLSLARNARGVGRQVRAAELGERERAGALHRRRQHHRSGGVAAQPRGCRAGGRVAFPGADRSAHSLGCPLPGLDLRVPAHAAHGPCRFARRQIRLEDRGRVALRGGGGRAARRPKGRFAVGGGGIGAAGQGGRRGGS